jgi:hypothetical protein
MKKLDLNRSIKSVSGTVLTVADLQRRIAPGVQVNEAQEQAQATMSVIAFSTIENQRGKYITDDQVKDSFSALKKIDAGATAKTIIEVEDSEFELVNAAFENQVISVRAQFLEMVEELNPAAE